MKRALKILGVIVAVLAVAAGIFWFVVFGNNKPIVDGEKLAPGIEQHRPKRTQEPGARRVLAGRDRLACVAGLVCLAGHGACLSWVASAR